jgi:hypothetical protein
MPMMPYCARFHAACAVRLKGTKKEENIGCSWLDRAKVFEDALVTEQYKMHIFEYCEFVLRVKRIRDGRKGQN